MRRLAAAALCLALAVIFAACGEASRGSVDPVELSEALPEGFPVLEGMDTVSDGTGYGGYLELVWRDISKDEADALAADINEWLDGEYDEKILYDDTLKYYSDGSKCGGDGNEQIHINFSFLPDGEIYNLTVKLSGKL